MFKMLVDKYKHNIQDTEFFPYINSPPSTLSEL